LGLGPSPDPVTFELPDRARLLFYTDGLVETRNHEGDFLPLDGRVAAALHAGTPGDALDALLTLLSDHAGHHINEDVALVLVEHRAGS
jgi:serine phosphatase RsbU (regulator of sigma subunit)